LGDVALGSSQVRAKAVETLIVERITAAGAKSGSPLLSGYTGTRPRPARLDHVPRVVGACASPHARPLPLAVRARALMTAARVAAVVFYAALRAVLEEDVPGGFAEEMGAKGGHQRGPGASVAQSLAALKAVRRRVNDRFFRKKWLPLESNPDIFNTLGRQLGLPPALEFLEVFGFDPELLAMLPPSAHAVLACFPLTEEYAKSVEASRSSAPPHDPAGPFFIHQSISNACGTVRPPHTGVASGACTRRMRMGGDSKAHFGRRLHWCMPSQIFLRTRRGLLMRKRGCPNLLLRTKTKILQGARCPLVPHNLPSLPHCAQHGTCCNVSCNDFQRALEEDEGLAVAHNQMAAQGATNPADFKGSSAQGFDAVLHFVVYVRGPDGFMYELDGLKAGPVRKGDTIVAPEGLLAAAVGEIKKMLPSNSEELRLNVMALCQA
jgi:hypothetical protein